jgi:hypothetical protein
MAKPPQKVRIIFFSPWADGLQDSQSYLTKLPHRDLSSKVSDPSRPDLMKMARLDCDWDGECLRSFAAMKHPEIEFLPSQIAGPSALPDLSQQKPSRDETSWFLITGQRPNLINEGIGRFLDIFVRHNKAFYWSFDEASRNMPCFSSVAPHLSVLIHDEATLSDEANEYLSKRCSVLHHSWTANMIPFSHPFIEEPEDKIVFLGSRLGITPQRQAQIDALKAHFKDGFIAHTDHAIPIEDRGSFSRYKVHLCPEGRMFSTEGMRYTHTDRPFWSGCLGQVPVIEDSHWGGRLESLVQQHIVVRYPHSDVKAMVAACERALAVSTAQRQKIYKYFNEFETIGNIASNQIAQYYRRFI